MLDAISYDKASKVEKRLNQAILDGNNLAGWTEESDAIWTELSEQNSQTTTLGHGLSVIESDTPSPLKVEFYGGTLTNLLGKKGNISTTHNIIEWFTIQIFDFDSGSYYLLKSEDWENISSIQLLDGSSNLVGSSETSGDYFKFSVSTTGRYAIRYKNNETNVTTKMKTALYKLTQSTYDQIGVSLTDAQVEAMFPYVDSVQHVVNPVVKVEGANLTPNDAMKIGYWAPSGDSVVNDLLYRYLEEIDISPNQTFTISSKYNDIHFIPRDENGYTFADVTGVQPLVFNTGNAKKLKLSMRMTDSSAWVYSNYPYDIELQINLGSTAKPFVPYNPSYLYAQTTLAGNSLKKDILSYNYGKSLWEKIKWWETDVVLDGSLSWLFYKDDEFIGYKTIWVDLVAPDQDNFPVVKYDGTILSNYKIGTGDTWNKADKALIFENKLTIAISDTDSGWTDAMAPTADQVKSYFYGWKYTGDGTTHSWRPLGDTDDTRLETDIAVTSTTPSATMLDGTIQPYKLTYQLAEPVTEVVDVEGGLSISGDAQVEVGEGVIVREVVTPVNTSGSLYIINDIRFPESMLKNKISKIFAIYKNSEDITNKWLAIGNNAYGSFRYSLNDTNFDPTAEYTVTYEVLDKYAITTNIQEVKATYQTSLKSSFGRVVEKQSDIATDQSILKRQMLDVLVRLEALEV